MRHNGKPMFRYGGWKRTYDAAYEDMLDSFNEGEIDHCDSPAILSAKGWDGKRRYALHLEER